MRDVISFDRLVVGYMCFALLISMPVNLLRLQNVPFFSGAFFNVLFAGFLVLAALNVLLTLRTPLAERAFALGFIVFISYIFYVGMLRGNDDVLSNLRYFVLPLAVYALLNGRLFALFFYRSSWFWIAILLSHVISLVYYYLFLAGTIYPGIGVPSLAYACIYFFGSGGWILGTLSLAIVVVEGKRGVLLALLIALTMMGSASLKGWARILALFASLSAFSILLSGALLFASQSGSSPLMNRINLINPFSNTFDLAVGSSGRYDEFISAFGPMSNTELVMGAGAGYTFEWLLGYSSSGEGEIKGYLHMSPASYVMVGGFVGLAVFTAMLAMPFRSRKLFVSWSARKVAFGLGIYSIVQSLFGFSLAVDAVALIFILAPGMMIPVLHRRRDIATSIPRVSTNQLERN